MAGCAENGLALWQAISKQPVVNRAHCLREIIDDGLDDTVLQLGSIGHLQNTETTRFAVHTNAENRFW